MATGYVRGTVILQTVTSGSRRSSRPATATHRCFFRRVESVTRSHRLPTKTRTVQLIVQAVDEEFVALPCSLFRLQKLLVHATRPTRDHLPRCRVDSVVGPARPV